MDVMLLTIVNKDNKRGKSMIQNFGDIQIPKKVRKNI
jgi:hypothetical protein